MSDYTRGRWGELAFPRAMSMLRPPVRAKAIEIANRLVKEGSEETDAVHNAIIQAKQWDKRRARGLGPEYF